MARQPAGSAMRPPSFVPVRPMKIESVRSLRGPNLWSNQTVLEAMVRFDGGVDLARARQLAERALALQIAVGSPVVFCDVRRVTDHQCRLLVQYAEEEVGKRALELALSQPLRAPV